MSAESVTIEVLQIELAKLGDACRRVLDLHKPVITEGRLGVYVECSVCRDCSDILCDLAEWPCDTIRALQGTL